jgi:hypothetical protein
MVAFGITANLRIGNNVVLFLTPFTPKERVFLGPQGMTSANTEHNDQRGRIRVVCLSCRASKQADASVSACVLQNDK